MAGIAALFAILVAVTEPGVYVYWSDSELADADRSPDCTESFVEAPLTLGFISPLRIENVTRISVFLQINDDDLGVADWWHYEYRFGDCPHRQLEVLPEPVSSVPGALDPWPSAPEVNWEGGLRAQDLGSRINFYCEVSDGVPMTIEANQPYDFLSIKLVNRTENCAGCGDPACLFVSNALIYADPVLSVNLQASADAPVQTWQGGAAWCGTGVAVESISFSALKSRFE